MNKQFFKIYTLLLCIPFVLNAQNRLLLVNNPYVVITNSANVVVDNLNTNAITTAGGGNIISEGEFNVVKWNVGNGVGNYVVPFTTKSFVKIPLALNITVAGTAPTSSTSVIFSTYETATDLNTNYPSDVTNMDSYCNTGNALYAVDRFWRIDANSYTSSKPTVIIDFGFDDAVNEIGGTNTIIESKLKAERFNSINNLWETPAKLYGLCNATINSVNGVSVSPSDFFQTWTLIDTTIMTIPIGITSVVNQTLCTGNTATITPSGATVYTIIPNNSSSSSSFTVNPLTTSSYTISGSIGSGTTTCSSVASTETFVTITVNITPTVSLVSALNSTICTGNIAIITPTGALTYTLLPNGSTGAIFAINPTASNTYTVVGSSGFCLDSITLFIYVASIPTISVSGATICSTKSSSLTASGGVSYTWSPSATLSSSTGDIVDASPINTTTYVVSGSSPLGCIGTATSVVNVIATPTITITKTPDRLLKIGETVQLNAISSANNYSWSPSNYLSCNDCDFPTASPPETITYCLKSENAQCADSVCITIDVERPCATNESLGLPNAFSPNGDGINDEYCLQGWNYCVTDFRMLIFDRWGEKVFETTDPSFCWDGTYKGQKLDPAVFVYYATAKFIVGTDFFKKGNITLIK